MNETEGKLTVAEGKLGKRISADLKRWFGDSLRVVLPMACSIALLCWLFHKVNIHDMINVLRHNVNYWWLGLMLVFNFLSYIIRGTRWGLQLDGVGIHARQPVLWVGVFGAYSLNLLFTGFGDTWRCVYLARQERASLTTVIGTVLGDRMSDLIAVLFVLLLTVCFADHSIHDFINQYAIGRETDHFLANPWVWGITVLVVMVCWAIGHFMKNYHIIGAIDECFNNIWTGLKVIVTMKHKLKYLWLTIAIWICYFMQTYICFFAFPFTKELLTPELCYGLLPGLVCLLFGSMSMAIPSSGGLGPWNLAIIFSLTLYGVGQTEATAFAMLAWGLEAMLQVILGIFTMVYVSRLDNHPKQQIATN